MMLDDDAADTGADETTELENEAVEKTEQEEADTAEADGKETEEKLPKDAPEWAVKRFGKLTAKRHEAEEARAKAETERDQYKSEAENAKAKYTDRDILNTAKRTGILPELMTKEEAQTLATADRLADDIERLEAALDEQPDGWDAGDRHVTAAEARGWLRKARNELKEIADDAADIRKVKASEMRELIRLGREAKAAAKAKPKAEVKPPVKVKPTQGAEAAVAAGVRRPATGAVKSGADLSKVKTREDLMKEWAKDYGG